MFLCSIVIAVTSLKTAAHKEELLEREIQRSSSELEVGAEGNVDVFTWVLLDTI